MIGIVVVSHSPQLARAAVELARQMVHGPGPKLAIAAGVYDGSLGTDATAIASAIVILLALVLTTTVLNLQVLRWMLGSASA